MSCPALAAPSLLALAYTVMAYVVMASGGFNVVMASVDSGLHSYDLHSYGLWRPESCRLWRSFLLLRLG